MGCGPALLDTVGTAASSTRSPWRGADKTGSVARSAVSGARVIDPVRTGIPESTDGNRRGMSASGIGASGEASVTAPYATAGVGVCDGAGAGSGEAVGADRSQGLIRRCTMPADGAPIEGNASSGPADTCCGTMGAAKPPTMPLGPSGSTTWPSGARKLGLCAVASDAVKVSSGATGGGRGQRGPQRRQILPGRPLDRRRSTSRCRPVTTSAVEAGSVPAPRLHQRATGHLPRSIRLLIRPISSANRCRS